MVQLQYSGMLERFKDVPDPRTRPNRIYPWQFLWGLDQRRDGQCLPDPYRHRTLDHRTPRRAACRAAASLVRLPCESTRGRTLASVDTSKLEATLTTLSTQAPPAPLQPAAALAPIPLVGQAIDGKECTRGRTTGHPCLLVGLVAHGSGAVLAQAKSRASAMSAVRCPVLLAGRNLHGTVLTLDALHTLKQTARLPSLKAARISWWSKRTRPPCTNSWICCSFCRASGRYEVWASDRPDL